MCCEGHVAFSSPADYSECWEGCSGWGSAFVPAATTGPWEASGCAIMCVAVLPSAFHFSRIWTCVSAGMALGVFPAQSPQALLSLVRESPAASALEEYMGRLNTYHCLKGPAELPNCPHFLGIFPGIQHCTLICGWIETLWILIEIRILFQGR